MIQRRAVSLPTMGFQRRITATRFALVRVVRGHGPDPHPALVAWFSAVRGAEFLFGTLDATRVRGAAWWGENFRTATGPLRVGPSGAEPGYYLFEYGVIVGHHTGLPRTTDAPRSVLAAEEALQARLEERVLDFPVPKADLRLVVQIAAAFDEVVRRRDGASAASWSDPIPTPPPSPRRPEPVADDPFAVLGVPPDATDAEISAAYREQMRLNHPDKVAHLSPALQKFASEQTLAIRAAWDRIRAMRTGLR